MFFYPPLLSNRIRPIYISENFQEIKVKISKSILNYNLHGTIFGGTISAAFDPWFGVMFWQILRRRNRGNHKVWVRNLHVQYKKPGNTSLFITFRLSDEEIALALSGLNENGKYSKFYEAKALDRNNEVCSIAQIEVYIINPNFRHIKK